MTSTIASFYRFARIADPVSTRETLERVARDRALRGTVLVATEGVNAQVAGRASDVDAFVDATCTHLGWRDVRVHRGTVDAPPFRRLRVRVRDEIVAIGDATDPARTGARACRAGTNCSPTRASP